MPLEARNSIALQIRRNIKEYVLKIFRSLTALYPNINTIKNDVYLISLINDINSLKSFLNSVKQNTQNLNHKLHLNNGHSISNTLLSKNSSLIQNKERKGRGGRYKNDFKNSFLFKNNQNNNNQSNANINNNANNNQNGILNLTNEVNNTDYSDNFEASAAENNADKIKEEKNGFAEAKALGKRRKPSIKILNNENADLNLSLNEEDNDKLKLKNSVNQIDNQTNNNAIIKKPRGRRKLIKNEDSLKFTFEISINENEIIETNKNVVFYDYTNIVILKRILETEADIFDRFIIEKNKLEQDVLEYFS